MVSQILHPFICVFAFYNIMVHSDTTTVDDCYLSKDQGPCFARVIRYAFNTESGKCEQFIFGGCRGNANNFKSSEECKTRCSKGQGASFHVACLSPPNLGLCHASLLRYFYNVTARQCQPFVYGGCVEGDANRFKSHRDCEKSCMIGNINRQAAICGLPPVTGKCRAIMLRWYYNTQTCSCQMFLYGGCGGNGNKFNTLEQCQSQCDVCSLKPDRGPGNDNFLRWFYNKPRERCETFLFSGLQGNGNMFDSEKECIQRCTCQQVQQ